MKWTVLHTPVKIDTITLLLTNILINLNSLPCVKGLKCRQNGVDRCCTNFKQEGESCIPCIGSFGINCTGGVCVKGFYGFGCREKCNCSVHEVCDHRIGCQKLCSPTTGTQNSAVIIVLCGVILCLFILLLAVVIRSKMLLSRVSIHRTNQKENTNITHTRSQSYESAENQTYVECDPIDVTDVRYPEDHFEYSSHSEVTSDLYLTEVPPPRVGVQMSVKEAFQKNRKGSRILHLLSQRNPLPRNTSPGCSYLSAVHSQQDYNNGDESHHYTDVDEKP